MKYKEIVKIIKNISLALPDVQSFYTGDVYEVNADQSVKYSSIVLTNQEHSFDNVNDRFQYNFILFYIDRLTDDEANRTDVHTAAVSALKAIVQHLEDYNVIINDFKFNLFRERFNDSCAGAYATLSVEVEDNDCTDGFSFDFGQISPDKLKEISITTNGTYTPNDGYYYTKVSVNVQPPLQSKTIEINENGTSTIVADSEHYGLGSVNLNVNVPTTTFSTEELSVTANGTYTPTTDGYSKVTVAVPIPEPNLQAKILEITANGTQTISADNGYDGLQSVSITTNVSGGTTSDKIKMIDGMKLNNNRYVIDYARFDTSELTDFRYMLANTNFELLPYRASIDLSTWDTSSATNMCNLFYNCSGVNSIIGLENWKTNNVELMENTFNSCTRITTLDLSNWNVSNVTAFSSMFYRALYLKTLNLSGWNMSKATRYNSYVFNGCTSLNNLNMDGAILPKSNLRDFGLDSCPLTVDSIVSVLNALPQLSSSESFTCTIGADNLAKLTDEQKAIATGKGWTLS